MKPATVIAVALALLCCANSVFALDTRAIERTSTVRGEEGIIFFFRESYIRGRAREAFSSWECWKDQLLKEAIAAAGMNAALGYRLAGLYVSKDEWRVSTESDYREAHTIHLLLAKGTGAEVVYTVSRSTGRTRAPGDSFQRSRCL